MLRELLHRPIAVTMVLIAIVTLGILSLYRIPVSLMPDIDVPRITVQMSSPGSSAREIEQSIVTPMRQQLSQVAGLKDIESLSRMDVGTVTLSFEPGSDMSFIFIEVNEKIDRAMNSMPKDMERPKVMKMGALDIPAFYIDITSRKVGQNGADVPVHELSRLARNVISRRIEQLPEVAMVDMTGTVGSRITIQPDRLKMAALGLTDTDIEQAVSQNNIILEALSVRDGIYRYSIHFDSQILSVSDIEDIYLRQEGRLIQLKEICTVAEEPAPHGGYTRSRGKDAVTLAVIKQNDAQMADLQDGIDTLICQMKSDYPDVNFEITRDQTHLLSYSMQNLEWNLVAGTVMACVVLFLFLGGWRMPLLVTLSIPLSLIITLMCFYLMGISLNVISLSGLILGVGMIVDNAIIVIDNIMQRGRCSDTNVVGAVREVFMPMLSSVLTTCSVFIPLIFLSGTAGALFYDQAMGVTIALFASLLVAVTIVPVYYYAAYRKSGAAGPAKAGGGRVDAWFTRWYERGMSFTFRNQKTVLACFLASVALIVLLFPHMRKERIPYISHNDALMHVDWNAEIAAEENDRRIQELMKVVGQSLESYTTMCGVQDFMLPHTRDLTGNEAVCYIKARSASSLDSVMGALERHMSARYPGAKTEFGMAASIFDMIFTTDMPELELRLQKREGGRPSVNEVRAVTDSLQRRFPQLGIQPVATETNICFTADPQLMADYRVTYQQLYGRLKQVLSCSHIYDISSGGENMPVVIAGQGTGYSTLLANTITNSDGVEIPMSYLLSSSEGEDFKRLSAGSEGEYAPVRIEKAGQGEVKDVIAYAKALVEDKGSSHADKTMEASFAGNYFASRDMVSELAVILLVAILLLYFILAAQFESLVQPCIILTEVAIDTCAVMTVLFLMGESLNIMSMIGLVVMSGIIVNDSILKVDTINHLRRSGMPIIRSIITAGHERLKPIIMTSLTTILAIVPFLHRGDMGSALQYPLSLTLIVGMTIGTLVSLFFVPLMYYIIYRYRK